MTTTTTNTPANKPLTQAEIEARKAIIEAANKGAADDTKAQLAAIHAAGNGKPTSDASKPTDKPNGDGANTTPGNDKPTGDNGKASQSPLPVGAATGTGTASGTASAAPKPQILPDLTKPTGDTKPAPKVDISAAGKGKGKGKGGKGSAKPEGKRAATNDAANGIVEGYDLNRWPEWLAAIKPTRWAILMARASNRYEQKTGNELALACYWVMGATSKLWFAFNVFDVGHGVAKVLNLVGDNKQNCALDLEANGWVLLHRQSRVPFKNPARTGTGGNGRIAYHFTMFDLDDKGNVVHEVPAEQRHAMYAYLMNNGEKVPKAMMSPTDIKAGYKFS